MPAGFNDQLIVYINRFYWPHLLFCTSATCFLVWIKYPSSDAENITKKSGFCENKRIEPTKEDKNLRI